VRATTKMNVAVVWTADLRKTHLDLDNIILSSLWSLSLNLG
jgi:hypothetical protein